ncbi:MAG: aldo/keto reductase, partial [Planctomycetota bacterium]
MSTEEPQKIETEEDKKLADHFLQQGYTKEQAKIKIVLQDKRISSACVGRGNLSHFLLNVAAALDKTKLSQRDKEVFKEYAHTTSSSYCAGCANICNSAVPDVPCISEIMRALMYYNNYREPDAAREV